MQITEDQLKIIMIGITDERVKRYISYLNAAMAEFQINTAERIAAFLAQISHESGCLKWMEEIASGKDYEGRKDLGNIHPGDGVKFKGRGPIQLTGRSNYEKAGKALNLDLINNPDTADDPDVGFRTAGWFWTEKKLNQYSDRPSKLSFQRQTKLINGGFNGWDSRWNYYKRACKVLNVRLPDADLKG